MADRFDETTQVGLPFLRSSPPNSPSTPERVGQLHGGRAGTGPYQLVNPHPDQHVLGQVCLPWQMNHRMFVMTRFLRCITGTPSTRFSRGEESCLANCVDRFLDTSLFMVKKIEEQRAQMNG